MRRNVVSTSVELLRVMHQPRYRQPFSLQQCAANSRGFQPAVNRLPTGVCHMMSCEARPPHGRRSPLRIPGPTHISDARPVWHEGGTQGTLCIMWSQANKRLCKQLLSNLSRDLQVFFRLWVSHNAGLGGGLGGAAKLGSRGPTC